MGFELIFGGLNAVIGLVSGIAQMNAASQQAEATAQAAAAQKEANAIQSAQQEVSATDSRRTRIREARVRRAMMMAVSQNQGSDGSSGQIGAAGALNTNLGTLFSSSLGESAANTGINKKLQEAADFQAKANAIGAWNNAFQAGLSGFQSIFK